MLNGIIARGTTPILSFPLPSSFKCSDFKDFIITFHQKGQIALIKRGADVLKNTSENIDVEKNIVVSLTQEETLLFNPQISVIQVEVKVVTQDNQVLILGYYRYRYDAECASDIFELEDSANV